MSINWTRLSKQHRSMPVGEPFVWLSRKTISGAPPRLEIANSRSDTGCLSHLNRVIVRSNSEIFIFSGRAIPQIPIGRCPH